MVSCTNDVCSSYVLKNIIIMVLTNVPLGTFQPLCSLCIVVCVVAFLLLPSVASSIY